MEQYYYNRMNKIEQAVYHALYQGFLNIDEEIQIPRLEGEALYNVFFKLRLDHPEIFWATGYKYRYYKESPNIIFIPEYLFESARIDCASSFQCFWKIKLPLMMPAFTIGLFLTLTNCFKLYDQNLTLTGGGPAKSTEMLTMDICNTAFSRNMYGMAQAKGIIFLVVVALITVSQLMFTKSKEVEM